MTLSIHAFFDPICPWCYIGKVRLDRALEATSLEADFMMLPFQLNPDMPDDGMDRTEYLETKFGGPLGAAKTYAGIHKAGAQDGITFRFDKIQKTPNTIKAHTLINIVQFRQPEQVLNILNAIYVAYFEQGIDIGDTNALMAIAQDCLSDEMCELARLAIENKDMRKQIRGLDENARSQGMESTPIYVLNNEQAVKGAISTNDWIKILQS